MATRSKGWIHDEAAVEEVLSSVLQPFFSEAGVALSGSGKGKRSLLFKNFEKLGIQYPAPIQSSVGDCTLAGTSVKMADGTSKNIEDIKVGEYVLDGKNQKRKVTDFIKKKYSGKIIKIHINGLPDPLCLTPDHKVDTYPVIESILNDKKNYKCNLEKELPIPAGELKVGNCVLVPWGTSINDQVDYLTIDLLQFCPELKQSGISKVTSPNGSGKSINRYITIDEDFAWLYGLFLAEGSAEPRDAKITFSLSSDEGIYANKIISLINKIFGIDAVINNHNRTDVTLVHSYSRALSIFFNKLSSGNVYKKSIDNIIFQSNYEVRKACLRGWYDGDGHLNLSKRNNIKNKDAYYCLAVGVTVSDKLARDIFNLSLSLKLNPTFRTRKKEKHQRVEAKTINLYSTSVISLYPEKEQEILSKVKINKNNTSKTSCGFVQKISKIEEFDVQDIYVYCLEVEVDHRFQANNIKIHNCVSHSAAIAVDTLAVTEIVNGERERWIARSANEYFYHTSRMIIGKGRLGGGDGSINAWVAKGLLEYGSLRRQKYDQVDLTKYSPSLSRSWGSSRNIPDGLYEIAKQNKIGRFAAIKNFSEACDALYNGYPIIVASNQGFSSKRDSEGFCKPSGSWAHSMGVLGYKDDDRRPAVLIANSWPSFLPGPNEFGLPPSCFWCDAEVFDRMCKFNDTFSFASFEGFKLKPNARII